MARAYGAAMDRAANVPERAGRTMLIPREHGAWATLIMPYLIGVGVAGRFVPEVLVFLVAVLSCFAARYPLSLAIKAIGARRAGRPAAWPLKQSLIWLAGYAIAGLASSLVLLFGYGRWGLLPMGLVAVLFVAIQPVLQRRRLDRTILAELLAFAGLTVTAAGAYYAGTGQLDQIAWALWLLNFLYSSASVFYVKLRVKQRVQRSILLDGAAPRLGRETVIYLAALCLALAVLATISFIPVLALVAFVPLAAKLLRAILRPSADLNLRRLGFLEVGHYVAFAVLLAGAYRVL